MKNKKETYSSKVTVWQLIKNVISWTLFSLLLIIALALVYYVFANYQYSKKGKGHEPAFSLFTIISPSMQPNIKVYDVIVDVPVKDPSTLKVGDIITFVSSSNISKGMTVTHRITQVKVVNGEYEFATKGDNNPTEDTATAKEKDVLGKVKLRIPQLGHVQYFLASRGGWLLVILIPAVIILLLDIAKIVKMLKVKKKVDDINKDEVVDEELKTKLEDRKQELIDKYQEEEPSEEIKTVDEVKKDITEEVIEETEIDLDDVEMELPKLKEK